MCAFIAIVRFHCPFARLSGCHDASGNGLTKNYLITRLWDRHCHREAQAITKHALLTDLVVFERAELTLKRIGLWLCGFCFTTHTLRTKCRYGSAFVPPLDNGDGGVRFVLYDLKKPHLPSCSQLDHVDGLSPVEHDGFTLSFLDSLFSKGLRTAKSIPPKCRLGFSRVLKGALDKVICKPDHISCWELKARRSLKSAPSLRDIPIDHHQLIASHDVVIKSFLRGTSCGRDGLCAQHLMDCLSGTVVAISHELVSSNTQVVNLFLHGKCRMILGGYIASFPLTPLVGLVVVSKVSATIIGHSLDGIWMVYSLMLGYQEGARPFFMQLIDRKVMLDEVRLRCPAISRWVELCYSSPARLYYEEHSLWSCQRAWYFDDGTIVRDTLAVDLLAKEDPRSKLEGVFPPNIYRPLHGVKLFGGLVSVDPDFSNALVMKRVSKTIGLLDVVAKINDPQCELLLIRTCARISKRYFAMRTCPPRVFESAQLSFDMALRFALERIVTAYGPGFGDWQWRLATPPFALGGFSVYSAGDILNYAFIFSRLQSAALQTKLLRHVGIVAPGSTFDDALCPLFSVSKPCSACSKVFTGDYYGDHAVSCDDIFGIKHKHNAVCDTLVDICFRSGISTGKEVDIGLGGGCDKALRHADMLLYSWDGGLDVCDVVQRKRGKYMAKCADIGYWFLPFCFSSLRELEVDAVTLLKRIRKFFMAQDIEARAAIHNLIDLLSPNE
nr:hypothetical protein [Tanacetum cinerariifolium]